MQRSYVSALAVSLSILAFVIPVQADRILDRDECPTDGMIWFRPLTACEWHEHSPREGDNPICTPQTLIGTNGRDNLYGGGADDVIMGKKGDDDLWGGGGDDLIVGGRGDDILRGHAGNDMLRGGRGDDHLYGRWENDELRGWHGDHTLTGGDGEDVFSFDPRENGDNIITDFEVCFDMIMVGGAAGLRRQCAQVQYLRGFPLPESLHTWALIAANHCAVYGKAAASAGRACTTSYIAAWSGSGSGSGEVWW